MERRGRTIDRFDFEGGSPLPVQLDWNAGALLWLLPAAGLYAVLLRRRRSRTRDLPLAHRQILLFTLGLLTVGTALGTPLNVLADRYLFSAHMLQIVLLTFVAPPLLLLGLPVWALRRAFRTPLAGRALRVLTHPICGMLLFNVAFSVYLVPAVYEPSLHSVALLRLDHAILFATACCMWWPIVSPLPEAPALSDPLQLLYVFVQLVLETVAFVLVTFAPAPLYSTYIHAPRLWGLTAIEDQQLGGAIMKIVVLAALAPFLAAAFMRWVRNESQQKSPAETRSQVAQRYRAAYHRSRAALRPSERPPQRAPAGRESRDLRANRAALRPSERPPQRAPAGRESRDLTVVRAPRDRDSHTDLGSVSK